MTNQEFKTELRTNRGKLSSESVELAMDTIYDYGTAEFVGYMMRTKKLGVENAANIIDKLTRDKQNKLISWIESKPSNITTESIALKVEKLRSGL